MVNKKKKIMLTGGGTLGSVTPLLAVYESFKESYDFEFVGTHNGVEKDFIKENYKDLGYRSIASGKLRRYISLKNISDIFKIIKGFIESFYLLIHYKPDVIITAGSFVSVPLVLAAAILRYPVIVHQLDLKVGLANRIMSWFSKNIFVTFEKNVNDFPAHKVFYTGSALRAQLREGNAQRALEHFKLNKESPTLVVIGGGTGAVFLNKIINDISDNLLKKMNVIVISGKGKSAQKCGIYNQKENTYVVTELLGDLYKDVLALADLVVTRAGLGTTYELMELQKPMIIIPIPHSQQVENAQYYEKLGVAYMLDQEKTSHESFEKAVEGYIEDTQERRALIDNLKARADVKINFLNSIKDFLEKGAN